MWAALAELGLFAVAAGAATYVVRVRHRNAARRERREATMSERDAVWRARRLQKREAQREHERAARRAKRERLEAMPAGACGRRGARLRGVRGAQGAADAGCRRAEERAKVEAASVEYRLEKKAQMERSEEARQGPFHVVVDCAYDTLHDKSTLKSLMIQARQLYAWNRRQRRPAALHLTSVSAAFSEQLRRVNAYNWSVDISSASVPERFADAVREGRVTVLSPDSPNVLHDVREDGVYVLGGIVDRSVISMVTLHASERMSLPHARLPIVEALPELRMSASTVLNIDTAAQAVIRRRETGEPWADVFRAILPARILNRYSSARAAERHGKGKAFRRRKLHGGQSGDGGDEDPEEEGEQEDEEDDEEGDEDEDDDDHEEMDAKKK